jgi:hypothetical protein
LPRFAGGTLLLKLPPALFEALGEVALFWKATSPFSAGD